MTIKQMKALQNMVENGGNMYRAMIDAGYSHAMAKNPHKLVRSSRVKLALSSQGLTVERVADYLQNVMNPSTLDHGLIVSRFVLK